MIVLTNQHKLLINIYIYLVLGNFKNNFIPTLTPRTETIWSNIVPIFYTFIVRIRSMEYTYIAIHYVHNFILVYALWWVFTLYAHWRLIVKRNYSIKQTKHIRCTRVISIFHWQREYGIKNLTCFFLDFKSIQF